jgi:hypothetical protein
MSPQLDPDAIAKQLGATSRPAIVSQPAQAQAPDPDALAKQLGASSRPAIVQSQEPQGDPRGFLQSAWDASVGGVLGNIKTALGTDQLSQIKDLWDQGKGKEALLLAAKYGIQGPGGRLAEGMIDNTTQSVKNLEDVLDSATPGHPANMGLAAGQALSAIPLVGPMAGVPVSQAATGNLGGAAGTAVGEALTAGASEIPYRRIYSSAASKMFEGSGKVPPGGPEAAESLGLEPSVGQRTGSFLANLLENSFAGKEKIAKEIQQTGKLQLKLGDISQGIGGELAGAPTAVQGTAAQNAIKNNYVAAKAVTKSLYNNFENTHLAANSPEFNIVTGTEDDRWTDPNGVSNGSPNTPIIQRKQIVGPIPTPNAAAEYQNVLKPQIDDWLSGDSFKTLRPEDQAKVQNLKKNLDAIGNGTTIIGQDGNPVTLPLKDYQTVKATITSLNDKFFNIAAPNAIQATMKKMASLLDKDMDNGVATWQNGAQATADLERAKAASQLQKKVFNPQVLNAVYPNETTGVPANPDTAFETAYQNPTNAREFMTALNPQNQQFMKSDYLDNKLTPMLWDEANSKWTPEKVINELSDQNSPSRAILTDPERQGILNFARAAQTVAPKPSGLTGYALMLAQGRIILHTASAATAVAVGASTGHALYGAGAGLAFEFGMKDFANNVLLNPPLARNAARLLKVPPGSAEAVARTKLMMLGMKGAQVAVNTSQGQQQGTVTDGGKIKLASQPLQ